MSLLRKNIIFTYNPADPGDPGSPGIPYTPAHCKTGESLSDVWKDFSCEEVTSGTYTPSSSYTATIVTYSIQPVYADSSTVSDSNNINLSSGTTIVGYVSVPTYTTVSVPTSYSGISSSGSSGSTTTTTSGSTDSWINSTNACINYWNSTGTVTITCTTGCSSWYWAEYSVCYPEQPAVPATPMRPPTPAELLTNFQEGWNASAQSIESLLPGKAALFRIGNGTRGALLGFAPEPWVPSLNTLPFGIMYSDGEAQVFENGSFKENLGYFFEGQEFIIGRTLDNYIMYINKTDGYSIARRKSPAAPTEPIHLFAVLYYGGDNVWI